MTALARVNARGRDSLPQGGISRKVPAMIGRITRCNEYLHPKIKIDRTTHQGVGYRFGKVFPYSGIFELLFGWSVKNSNGLLRHENENEPIDENHLTMLKTVWPSPQSTIASSITPCSSLVFSLRASSMFARPSWI